MKKAMKHKVHGKFDQVNDPRAQLDINRQGVFQIPGQERICIRATLSNNPIRPVGKTHKLLFGPISLRSCNQRALHNSPILKDLCNKKTVLDQFF